MAKRADKEAGRKRGRVRGPARRGKGRRARATRSSGAKPATARPAVTSGPVDVTALSLAELAELLGVSLQEVKAHADDGAPVGADGRVNLVEFAAWANRRLQRARPR